MLFRSLFAACCLALVATCGLGVEQVLSHPFGVSIPQLLFFVFFGVASAVAGACSFSIS
jgi:hypothetical protein